MAIPDPSVRSALSTDPTLAPFLSPSFSPVAYLNSTLPSWSPSASTSTTASTSTPPTTVTSLADLSAQSQTLIAQLDVKLARLSTTLTQLTDDILRSGGRLSYEVEILRADAANFGEVLSTGLKSEIIRLVQGVSALSTDAQDASSPATSPGLNRTTSNTLRPTSSHTLHKTTSNTLHKTTSNISTMTSPKPKPEYINALHTLALVRARLDTVIQTFDAALGWHLPPSSLSLKNQFVSVAGPHALSADNKTSPDELEAKGKDWEEKTREEIADLLDDDEDGAAVALQRVADLRALCTVWKGTVEEKPRLRFVETLEKMLERKNGAEE